MLYVTRFISSCSCLLMIHIHVMYAHRWTRSATQNKLMHLVRRAMSTACRVFSVVIVRARSRAGWARGRERGGVTVLGVRTVVLNRRSGHVACSALCNPAPLFHSGRREPQIRALCCFVSCSVLLSSCRTRTVFLFLLLAKRQLWVRPTEWLKLNFASCVIRQTYSCLLYTSPSPRD